MANKPKIDGLELDAETLNRLQQIIDMLGDRIEVAKIAGLSRSGLQKTFYGQSSPKFEAVKRLCEAAGISLDWLATGKAIYSSNSSDPWKLPTDEAFIYQINQSPKKGEVAYFEKKDGKGLLAVIEKETKEHYEVRLLGEEGNEKLTVKKSDLSIAAPTQMVKSLG